MYTVASRPLHHPAASTGGARSKIGTKYRVIQDLEVARRFFNDVGVGHVGPEHVVVHPAAVSLLARREERARMLPGGADSNADALEAASNHPAGWLLEDDYCRGVSSQLDRQQQHHRPKTILAHCSSGSASPYNQAPSHALDEPN